MGSIETKCPVLEETMKNPAKSTSLPQKVITALLAPNVHNNYGCDFNIDNNYPIYHDHEFWEISYILAPCLHKINGEEIRLEKNTILIVRPWDCHCFTDCKDSIGQINFKLTERHIKLLLDYIDEDFFDALKHENFRNLAIKATLLLENEIREFIGKVFMKRVNKQTFVNCKFIVVKLLEYVYKFNIRKEENSTPPVIQQAMSILSSPANFRTKTNDLLSNLGYSYIHLFRLFKKYTEKTPIEYFTESKMVYASNQLLFGNFTIVEIANLTGYATQSCFDVVFKKHFGVSPKEYRQKNAIRE